MKRPATRNRNRTQEALIEAVGAVIDEGGVPSLGVNAVARRAGVDKALIYRYFDGLDGLVEAFAHSEDFWPTVEEVVGDRAALKALPFGARVERVFTRYVEALRRRPRTIAILGSELMEHSPLHLPLERAREKMGIEVLKAAAEGAPPGVDLPALATLMTAAIHYLLARSRFVREFNGIRLDKDEGWRRLLGTIRQLASAWD